MTHERDESVASVRPESRAASGGAAPHAAGHRAARAIGRDELERVRNRDPDALSRFFEAHFDRVYGLLFRLLGDRHNAEDVTQEVFFRVFRAIQQLDPTRDAGPWIMTITYNTCRDYWRSGTHKLARRSVSVDDDPTLAERLPSAAANPERAAIASERERLVQDAIRDLPETMRAVIVLHDYQGLGHDEIARMTGVSHAAVRKRYSRALDELGKRLRGKLS